MQWNIVEQTPGAARGCSGEVPRQWFYFVHSYAPDPEGEASSGVVGTCDYGGGLSVAFELANVFGTQFHPEKSASAGLGLLSRFARICGDSGA